MERLGTINENAGEERDPSHGGRRRIMIFLAAVGLAGAVLLCVAASAAKGMPEGMSARIRAGAGQEDAATVSLKPEVREAADVLAGIAETCQYPEGQGYAAPHKISSAPLFTAVVSVRLLTAVYFFMILLQFLPDAVFFFILRLFPSRPPFLFLSALL